MRGLAGTARLLLLATGMSIKISNHIYIYIYIYILYNDSISLGEIFLNPNSNRIIRLFHLPTLDRPQTGFRVTRGPSIRAGSGEQVGWSGSLDTPS